MTKRTPLDFFAELETRQDELIERIDELNARIESALSEFAAAPSADGSDRG